MRTHLFTKKAEQAVAAAKKRLAMALDSHARAERAVEVARGEVAEAEYRLSLEREADVRSELPQ